MTGDNVLCKNWYLFGEKKFEAMPTKQDLGTSWQFVFKIPEYPHPFYL